MQSLKIKGQSSISFLLIFLTFVQVILSYVSLQYGLDYMKSYKES